VLWCSLEVIRFCCYLFDLDNYYLWLQRHLGKFVFCCLKWWQRQARFYGGLIGLAPRSASSPQRFKGFAATLWQITLLILWVNLVVHSISCCVIGICFTFCWLLPGNTCTVLRIKFASDVKVFICDIIGVLEKLLWHLCLNH